MPRGPATFKQADVVRAVKAGRNAGLDVGAFEVTTDGTIRVLATSMAGTSPISSEFDKWKASKNASATERH